MLTDSAISTSFFISSVGALKLCFLTAFDPDLLFARGVAKPSVTASTGSQIQGFPHLLDLRLKVFTNKFFNSTFSASLARFLFLLFVIINIMLIFLFFLPRRARVVISFLFGNYVFLLQSLKPPRWALLCSNAFP